jgi:hypothetical protein
MATSCAFVPPKSGGDVSRLGVSADRFLHLDGYNGWSFANRKDEVEPDHVPGVVVTADGLTLPQGELPAGAVPPHVDSRGAARAASPSMSSRSRVRGARRRRAFCLVAGRDIPPTECCSSRRMQTQIWRHRHRRARPAVRDAAEEGEVRVLRISPAGELDRVRMVHPVSVAIDAQERLVVLDTGTGTPPPSASASRPSHRARG